MAMSKLTPEQQEARRCLGPHWRRRLNAFLDTLIEAEPALHAAARADNTGNIGRSVASTADAARRLVGDGRYA